MVCDIKIGDKPIIETFPREIADLAPCGSRRVRICVEPIDNLTEEKVARMARNKYSITKEIPSPDVVRRLYGFLCCADDVALVFFDPQYGEACARFTIAHELGHLFQEHLPRLGQYELFGPRDPPFLATRETAAELARGVDLGEEVSPEALAQDYARLRLDRRRTSNEVYANSFATEVLAPFREVEQLLAGVEDRAERVKMVRKRFGLSRTAAEIRVDELYGESDQQATLEFHPGRH